MTTRGLFPESGHVVEMARAHLRSQPRNHRLTAARVGPSYAGKFRTSSTNIRIPTGNAASVKS
jgi:hypothetical protein